MRPLGPVTVLILLLGLVFAAPVLAIGPVVGASCSMSWTEPQTNTDGSNLADLKEYRIYVTQPPGLYGSTAAKTVQAPAADPPTGATVQTPCPPGIPQGQNYATVIAVDTAGNPSPRSNESPFVLDTVAPGGATGFTVSP